MSLYVYLPNGEFDSTEVTPVNVGDTVKLRMPWSEVCMSMRVADRIMDVRVLQNGAQLLNDDGTPYSFPITHGEAGVFGRPE